MKKNCCNEVYSLGIGPFIGRFLLSLIFVLAGLGKLFAFSTAVSGLVQKGIDARLASLLIGGAIFLEVVGGLSVLLGFFTRVGAILLMIFLLPTTFLFHDFWNYEGMEAATQMSHFLKNIALFGGLFLLLSFGPGRFSFDARRAKKTPS